MTRCVALVGNPNCGKTTLFNALTGANQKVGNWPGVTVERISGQFTEENISVEVVDLPGTYSLTLLSDSAAIDESIACEFIHTHAADVIINIVDASNLERHLYLTTQLLEMGAPVILALNMMDIARARGININLPQLSLALGCPVIALEANKGKGVDLLKKAVLGMTVRLNRHPHESGDLPAAIKSAVTQLMSKGLNRATVIRLLEDDQQAQIENTPEILAEVKKQQLAIREETNEDADILIAEMRYRFIQQILQQCLSFSSNKKTTWTARIDNVVLNRFLGIPVFLLTMYLLFVFAIGIGGYFQDYFDSISQTIFVEGLSSSLSAIGTPTWLTVLLANGIGRGINTVVTFVPVIGAMFLFLSMLEDSGYMARAAFVIDRLMCALGLPGKAFVPMIIGFGCNVPAVMAARTLEHKRDRILTIMMTPFMSCSARLAIYAVFTASFFPHGGQNIVFALYLIGIAMAVLTGFLLQKTLLKGDPAPLMMELPAYHMPHVKTLLLHAWQRLKGFVFRAGKLIIPICMLIGVLNTLNIDGSINVGEGDIHSLLSIVGQWLTPIFTPMGIQAENWPATVGIVTGVLAKEVVVGTLNTLYTQMGQVTAHGQIYGLMYQKFDGQIGAFAYLLFVLLYFPCVSTMAVMLREIHRGWTIFSAVWMISIAYGVAVIFYQSATGLQHPLSSLIWIMSILMVFLMTIAVMRWLSRDETKRHVVKTMPVGETL